MPNYRRAFVPNGCWFFTHNLLERSETLLVDRIDALRSAFEETRKKFPFEVAAIVILPDHLHAIWTLPPDDVDFSIRWRLIKTRFAKSLPKLEGRPEVRQVRGERGTGSDDSGSISFAMTRTMPVMLSIATSIR